MTDTTTVTAAATDATAAPLYRLRVVDAVNDRIAGHGGRAYTSPAQPLGDALALAGLLLGGIVASADGSERWTGAVAVPGGRRTVTVEPADRTR